MKCNFIKYIWIKLTKSNLKIGKTDLKMMKPNAVYKRLTLDTHIQF